MGKKELQAMAGIKKTPQVYLFYGEESYLVQKMAANLVDSLLDPSEREFNLTSLEADPPIPELLHLVESFWRTQSGNCEKLQAVSGAAP